MVKNDIESGHGRQLVDGRLKRRPVKGHVGQFFSSLGTSRRFLRFLGSSGCWSLGLGRGFALGLGQTDHASRGEPDRQQDCEFSFHAIYRVLNQFYRNTRNENRAAEFE